MIELRLVKRKFQKELVSDIIKNHHSYVPSTKSVGRKIDYLVYSVDNSEVFPAQEKCIGMIGIGSSTYPPCKDVLSYLNLSKYEYKEIFNSLANNWRFCLSESIPNISSKIISILCKISKRDWKEKYGDDLKYIITYVGGNKEGTCYKAANWEFVGYTSGLPPHKSVSMKWNRVDLKERFVKPDGNNKKKIFIKKIK